MAILNQKRILNLIPKVSAPVTIHVSQGDVGTQIEFTLVKGDEVFSDTGNLIASVHGVREDGANFGPFTCTLSGSKVTFPLHSEMTAVKGSALAEIVLVDNGGNKVGSANFGILVEESVFPLGVTYDNDVSVYESILTYVQRSLSQAIALFNSLQEQFDQVIAGVTVDSEVILARLGANGITYDTLRDCLVAQFSTIFDDIPKTMLTITPFYSTTVYEIDGTTATYNHWYASNEVDVSNYQNNILWYKACIYGSMGSGTYLPPVTFLDSNHNFLKNEVPRNGSNTANLYEGICTIPNDAAYAVFLSSDAYTNPTYPRQCSARAGIITNVRQLTATKADAHEVYMLVKPQFSRSLEHAYKSDGEQLTSGDYYCSNKVDIHNYVGMILHFYAPKLWDNGRYYPPVIFFDSTNNMIDYYYEDYKKETLNRSEGEILIPSDAYYVAFLCYRPSSGINDGYGYITRAIDYGTEYNSAKITELQNVLKSNNITIIKNDRPFSIGKVYRYDTGQQNYYAGWYQSELIPISSYVGKCLNFWASAYGSSGSSPNIPSVVFFDSNKNYLSSIETINGNATGGRVHNKCIIPTGAEYMALTSAYISGNVNIAYAYISDIDADRITKNTKLIVVGDSITHGDYGSNPPGTANDHLNCYPYYLADEIDGVYKRGWIAGEYSDSDFNVMNTGVNGATPKSWYNSVWNRYENLFDYTKNPAITVVIMFGANCLFTDTVDTDTSATDSQIGYYKRIIEEINTKSQGHAQIILVTPTYIDSNRNAGAAANVKADNPIVKKLAAFYNLPCIDAYYELGVSSINTSVMQPIDGTHFGADGYKRLGSFILSKLKSLISF